MDADLIEMIRSRLSTESSWTQHDGNGGWICPFCEGLVPEARIYLKDPSRTARESAEPIARHIEDCLQMGKEAPKPAPMQVLAPSVPPRPSPGAHTRVRRPTDTLVARGTEFARYLRKALQEDDIWRQKDDKERWFCPYCGEFQSFNLPRDMLLMLQDVPFQITEHVLKSCRHYLPGKAPMRRIRVRRALPDLKSPANSSAPQASAGSPSPGARSAPVAPDSTLDEAKRRQRRMLPPPPTAKGFEFSTLYLPASSVSGDFYDFVNVSEEQIGIVIGDVTGHGIEAGIVMAMVRKLISYIGRTIASPVEVLSIVNDEVFGEIDVFVSVFYGILDTRERVLTYCRAGHNPPILYNPGRIPATSRLTGTGMAIGVDVGPPFQNLLENVVVELKPQDVILAYTDGLTEAMAPDGEEFGEFRIVETLERYAPRKLDEMMRLMMAQVQKFAKGVQIDDDIAMVGVKVL